MNTISQERAHKAGFRIIRKDEHPIRIKINTGQQAWATLETFPTKAARDRRFDELMRDEMTITD